jgi:hypothetical protein
MMWAVMVGEEAMERTRREWREGSIAVVMVRSFWVGSWLWM